MEVKLFEVRDAGTFLPVMAIKLKAFGGEESYLLHRAGYGRDPENYVLLIRLSGDKVTYDPFQWGNRTMEQAHLYIRDNFDSLVSGQVVDIQFLLGETKEIKISEAKEGYF